MNLSLAKCGMPLQTKGQEEEQQGKKLEDGT